MSAYTTHGQTFPPNAHTEHPYQEWTDTGFLQDTRFGYLTPKIWIQPDWIFAVTVILQAHKRNHNYSTSVWVPHSQGPTAMAVFEGEVGGLNPAVQNLDPQKTL